MGIRSTRRFTIVALGIVAILVAAGTPAQLLTGHAQPLPGTTPSQSIVGMAIALSNDGTVALVGAPFTNSGQGAAYVYTQTNGVWSAPVALTLPTFVSSTPDFGRSVALSSDGTMALVGAPFENSSTGAAYVYTLSGGSWSGPTALSVSGLSNLSEFGYSVALSMDSSGFTPEALVGAPNSNGLKGAAYVYTLTSGSWSSPTTLSLTGVPSNSLLGDAVALFQGTALVGAPSASASSTGNAYIYTETSGSWSNPSVLDTTGVSAGDSFGSAVALEQNMGITALVGAPATSSNTGAVYTFSYTIGSGWVTSAVALNMTGVPSGGKFGASLALNSDTAVVGAPSANGSSGAAYFYGFDPNTGPTALDSTGVETGAQMGYAVALSGTGVTAAVTATGTSPGYVFGSPVDMAIAVTAAADSVVAGQDATFDIWLSNPDTSATASNVILTDVLPAGTRYVSASSSQGNCSYSQSTSTVTCTFANLLSNNTFLSGGGVTLTAGPTTQTVWQDEVALVVETPAAGGVVQDTASLSADQELTGTTTAKASVTATASASQGGSGGSGGTAESGSSGGGGSLGGLSLLTLLGVGLVRKRCRATLSNWRKDMDVKGVLKGVLLGMVLGAIAGCATTGGDIGGLVPAPKFLKGSIDNSVYTAKDGRFTVSVPHAQGSYEYTYMQVKEQYSQGEDYVSFGPGAVDQRIYRIDIVTPPAGRSLPALDTVVSRMQGLVAQQAQQSYGTAPTVGSSQKTVIGGHDAYTWEMQQSVPSMHATLTHEVYMIYLGGSGVTVWVQTPSNNLSDQKALTAEQFAESLKVPAPAQ